MVFDKAMSKESNVLMKTKFADVLELENVTEFVDEGLA